MRGRDHARDGQLQRRLPSLSLKSRTRDHIGQRSCQCERLELACPSVVVEKDRAHPRSRSPRGSASMSVFKSLDLSTVVTSTNPSFTTTTRFETPYNTTSPLSACTTLSWASTACTCPLVALPLSSPDRTRRSAPHVPTSSQPKSPAITITRRLRSSTPTSTETDFTA